MVECWPGKLQVGDCFSLLPIKVISVSSSSSSAFGVMTMLNPQAGDC